MVTPEEYMLPCLNKKLLGFECLGCGLQRSVALLFQGEFIAAFQMYPAVYPLLALAFSLAGSLITKQKYFSKLTNILAVVTIATAIIAYLIKLMN